MLYAGIGERVFQPALPMRGVTEHGAKQAAAL